MLAAEWPLSLSWLEFSCIGACSRLLSLMLSKMRSQGKVRRVNALMHADLNSTLNSTCLQVRAQGDGGGRAGCRLRGTCIVPSTHRAFVHTLVGIVCLLYSVSSACSSFNLCVAVVFLVDTLVVLIVVAIVVVSWLAFGERSQLADDIPVHRNTPSRVPPPSTSTDVHDDGRGNP